MIGAHREAVRLLDACCAMADAHLDAACLALGQQHGHDLPRRAVAEQLAQRLLVPGDAVLFDQGDEVVLGVAGQGRLAEVRVGRQERLGPRVQVGEIAAATTGDQDLLADLVGMLQHQHPAPALAGALRAHQARPAGPNDNHVELALVHETRRVF